MIMLVLDPHLRRTWLFGPGADSAAHAATLGSGLYGFSGRQQA
jgi:hypothetical protein